MAKVPKVSLNSLTFNLLPQEVKVRNSHRKLKLAAILQPQFGINGAQIVASLRDRKQKIKYSAPMLKFIKKNSLDQTLFAPLETFLKDQLKQAKKSPGLFLTILQTYLSNGQTPNFSVSYLVDPPPPPPVTSSPTTSTASKA
jgi:hypothetical protein